MSAQLLAHALAVAHNPHAAASDLFDAASDLINFGALDTAESAVARLRDAGWPTAKLERLTRTIAWFRNLGPLFEDRMLTKALSVVRREDASDEQLLAAADSLVVWGSLNEADAALARLRDRGFVSAKAMRLAAASQQLRRSGVLRELSTLDARKSLHKPYEVLVRRRPGATRTLVVLAGAGARFWLSLNALHVYLRRLDANVIYLKDLTAASYVNGLASIGGGYHGMLAMLREQIAGLGGRSLHMLATSAGGFVGLRAAIDLEADSFAGLSIRSDLSPGSALPTTPYERYVIKACRDPAMLIDLRPLVERSAYPARILLYTGDRNRADIEHAEHLRGINRVSVTRIENHSIHDSVSGMIARGTFMDMLRDLVGEAAAAPSAQA